MAIRLKNNIDCVILDCDLSETLCCEVCFRDMKFLVTATYHVHSAHAQTRL